jgi:glyoxylase I family protein
VSTSSEKTAAGTVGLNHMGLCVSDLAASTAFYRDVAGFTVLSGPYHMSGEWFDTITRNEGADIEVAMLELDGFTLQLVQYHAAGADPAPTGHNHVGNPHLCINVVDVEAKHATVVASGAHRPTEICSLAGTGYRSFYVEDPDGTPVESLQAPRS